MMYLLLIYRISLIEYGDKMMFKNIGLHYEKGKT